MVAQEFGLAPKYRVLSRPMLNIAGLFIADVRESCEMLYQYDAEYLFDSSKFSRAFNVAATSYAGGIKRTAAALRR